VCPRVTLEQLEERIVLDAAVPAAPQDQPEHKDNAPNAQTGEQAQPANAAQACEAAAAGGATAVQGDPLAHVFGQDLNVVLISNALSEIKAISEAASPNAHVIIYDAQHDNLATLAGKLHEVVEATGEKVDNLAIVEHATPGVLTVGTNQINFFNVNEFGPVLGDLGNNLAPEGQIQFYGCSLAGNVVGKALVDRVASLMHAYVFASIDDTGGLTGNWNLEYSSYTSPSMVEVLRTENLASVHLAPDDYVAGFLVDIPDGSSNWVNVNGTLFFTAWDSTRGSELWKSDGTDAGTGLVKDIYPGTGNSVVTDGSGTSCNPYLTDVNGTLFFVARNSAARSWELWKSDGTDVGTAMVKDICPVNYASSWPSQLTNVNGLLFFRANDGTSGMELWESDGTGPGTSFVKDICSGSGSSSPDHLINVNGKLFFSASDGASGTELWMSDGTLDGTVRVKDIKSGSGSSSPSDFVNVNGTLFFMADDGSNGRELWKSDGTESGTVMVKDICLGATGSYASNKYGQLTAAAIGTDLFFFANQGGAQGVELWKSNDTGTSTMVVKDVDDYYFNNYPPTLCDVDGIAYFKNYDSAHGQELWKSDGTASGTFMVTDINTGTSSGNPRDLVELNGALYFVAGDATNGSMLWRTDGTESGTEMVQGIPTNGFGSGGTGIMADVNNALFFVAQDSAHGKGLWKFDGTQKLSGPDGSEQEKFGVSVSIDGNYAIVGACWDDVDSHVNQGSAYIYELSGGAWSYKTKLTAPEGADWDKFGASVYIHGNYAIVGADGDDVGSKWDQGSAYIYELSGGVWSYKTKLTAPDGAAGDEFGSSVCLDGNYAIVGVPYADVGSHVDQGSAYIYELSGGAWSYKTKLTAPDGAAGDCFGGSGDGENGVSIHGNYAIVGVPYADVGSHVDQGSAYIYELSGGAWSYKAKLTAPDGAAGDEFGESVCIDGNYAIVGTYGDVGSHVDQGSAYIYELEGAWSYKTKLTAPDGAAGDLFGRSVSSDGNYAIVGALYGDYYPNMDVGSAYIYFLAPAAGPKANDFCLDSVENTSAVLSGWDFTNADGHGAASIKITNLPDHGTLFRDADGDNVIDAGEGAALNQVISWADAKTAPKVKYFGDTNYAGSDSFQYVVIDTASHQGVAPADAGTVSVTVRGVDHAPPPTVTGSPTVEVVGPGNPPSTGLMYTDHYVIAYQMPFEGYAKELKAHAEKQYSVALSLVGAAEPSVNPLQYHPSVEPIYVEVMKYQAKLSYYEQAVSGYFWLEAPEGVTIYADQSLPYTVLAHETTHLLFASKVHHLSDGEQEMANVLSEALAYYAAGVDDPKTKMEDYFKERPGFANESWQGIGEAYSKNPSESIYADALKAIGYYLVTVEAKGSTLKIQQFVDSIVRNNSIEKAFLEVFNKSSEQIFAGYQQFYFGGPYSGEYVGGGVAGGGGSSW